MLEKILKDRINFKETSIDLIPGVYDWEKSMLELKIESNGLFMLFCVDGNKVINADIILDDELIMSNDEAKRETRRILEEIANILKNKLRWLVGGQVVIPNDLSLEDLAKVIYSMATMLNMVKELKNDIKK